jgi:alpha-glucosidase
VAFRYRIPQQSNLNEFEIIAEHSEFNFFENHHCWALQLENFATNYENTFNPLTLQDLKPDQIIGLPLTIVSQSGTFMAITEANLTDYAGMYLEGSSILDFGLISRLSPLPSGERVCVRGTTPHFTPWRVIMIADDPGNLIESNIILNLNEPCAISDISWIKPGKVAWPWWSGRVVSNVDFDGGMNTATMKHYIDFATVYGLEYLLIDATWYGPYKDPSQDITTTIPEVDLPNIISYANANNVDIILWLHWQNTRDQMDKAFPLYEKWGVKGVKVDYMNRDDQEMVNFYHEVVKKAAEHHLLVDFHGSYKPSGIRRTYPNLMTREGILGLEHTKWSNRVTPDHNVTIPYTRMLAGPMDYTPGAFQNVTEKEFKSQYIAPMAMGTRCHHLAMFVVYESPLQMCCDYPGSYRDEAGADFLKVVPASWDETRAINGDIGEFIVIVRRHDDDWFVGAMTNWESRTVGFPLDFLSEGQYELTNYSDGRDAEENPRSISVTSMRINSGDSLSVIMASGGGYVAHLTPVIN